ncbi:hypothetical protein FRC03_000150 [Tulasnella sp. 419]|nr:hypothetical protein FRC02_002953 [Tulasnella sp. 418]KAG8969904.1 hypothetical protein FRC03_000150 [Tulasnella sp. 419]
MSSGSHLTAQRAVSHELPYSRPPTPSQHPTLVGIIGLGNIGYPLARNMALHLSKVPNNRGMILYNRTKEKAEKLVAEIEERSASEGGGIISIKIVETIEEVAAACDIVITSLSNDKVVEEVYQKIATALTDNERGHHDGKPKPKIIVDTSTVFPTLTGHLDSMLSAIPHTFFVAAPVFGAPVAADKAQLLVVLAGEYRAKKEVAYLFVPAVGRKVIDLGGNVEKATTFKLIGNSYIAGTIELLAESFTLAEKAGVGMTTFFEWIQEFSPTPSILNYSNRILNNDFNGNTGFSLDGGIKDVHHAQRLASQINAPAPILDITHQHLLTARAIHNSTALEERKFETLDWSSMVSASRVASGLNPFDSAKNQSGVIPEDSN